jgi:hypothetical protein
MGILLKVDGSYEEVLPKDNQSFTLEELQEYVGGYIERIDMFDGHAMYVDEEGRLKNSPTNILATGALLQALHVSSVNHIKGNAIIVPYKEER